jgi:hypothetical protein
MSILIISETTQTPGPEIAFDCPACGKQGVVGKTSEVTEKNRLFWIIPLFTSRVRGIVCGQCGRAFRTSLTLEQLRTVTREELSRDLAAQVDFLAKFCIITGLVLAIVPFLGLVFAGIGTLCTFKRRTGWRTAAIIALVVSVIFNGGILFLLMLKK